MTDGVIMKNVVIFECIHYTAGVKFILTGIIKITFLF